MANSHIPKPRVQPRFDGSRKMVDVYGCFPGHAQQQVDATQAYVQADLEGEEIWVNLPPEVWRCRRELFYDKEDNPKFQRPCVRLRKALYGHPDAGSCWERHYDVRLVSQGFEKCTDWPSCYFHKRLKTFLMVYVNDFKSCGLKSNLAEAWKLIGDVLEVDPPTEPGLVLGCLHEVVQIIIDGSKASGIICSMESCPFDTVMNYCDMVCEFTGQKVNLGDDTKATTPFLPEDQKDSPIGKPISNCRAALCPHCESSFPVWDFGSDPPAYICGSYDIKSLKKGCYPFGSPIYQSPKDIPQMVPTDLQRKAIDPIGWCIK